MRFRGTTLFVTGGAGFIGSAVIRHLLDETEANVVNIDKLTYAWNLSSIPQAADHPRYRFARVDICDGPALRRLFETHAPHAVMNLAAESHVDRSIDGPAEFIETNIAGPSPCSRKRCAIGADSIARRSSASASITSRPTRSIGSLGAEGLFTETTPYAPNSPYAASKASSDHLVRAWRETYGLPTLLTNCSNNYGPYHFPEKLIPHMIIRGLAGQSLPVYGSGDNVRDWLYVEDHARALALVVEQGIPGETYNIGGRQERRNIDVVREICRLLDRHAPLARRLAGGADRLRRRPARARPPLRHRPLEDRARARLARDRDLRDGACQDRALVSRAPRLVAVDSRCGLQGRARRFG